MAIRVLFVCTGNTCRSSMAEALMRRLVESRAAGEGAGGAVRAAGDATGAAIDIEVKSAGTGAHDGGPASDNAIAVMRELGIDLRGHRSRRLTQDLVDWADLILTMTASHKMYVTRTFRRADAKTFTLGEYAVSPGNSAAPPAGAAGGSAAGQEGAPGDAAGSRVGTPRPAAPLEVEDPYGRPVDTYRRVAEEIEKALASAYERMAREAAGGMPGARRDA
ncbi:MAG: low molecular weight protein arginine phosphatase [Firmicutes bacterium]|nr:low molecular weight protein arginine phosphatase [Bacillota bacterium]